jgi:hypothetical protein
MVEPTDALDVVERARGRNVAEGMAIGNVTVYRWA